jgi:hypothetical protein
MFILALTLAIIFIDIIISSIIYAGGGGWGRGDSKPSSSFPKG